NNDWDSGYVSIALNDGTYDVVIRNIFDNPALDDTVIITSIGSHDDALSIIEMTTVPEYFYPFKYGMFAKDELHIYNSMIIDSYNSDSGSYADTQEDLYADIGSNDTVFIENNAWVGGNASSALEDGVVIFDSSSVKGELADNVDENIVPDIPQSEYDSVAILNDNMTGISGTYTYNTVTNNFSTDGDVILGSGTYYFDDFILKNSASLTLEPGAEVTIYITGKFEIKNSGDINSTEDPSDMIINYQGTDFDLKNSGTLTAAIFAPNASAVLHNSGDFYGSILANTVDAHNSAAFHYDQSLSEIIDGVTGKMLVVGWQEL
ncbi:MAG: hypothetical protein U9N54_11905, partial [candidate division Zixibacteria bacterium]|nr:hypothetical protein [candidate division Zixibacteria bacterium]